MTQKTERPFYCSECSRAAGEQLLGSAPRADIWLLLEYGGLWGAKSPDDSDLPDAIKARIRSWVNAIPNSKFTFIKQREEGEGGAIRFYVARSLEMISELYRINVYSYDALLELDIMPMVEGAPEAVPYQTEERLFAICTNGRRDVSCARYGTPVFHKFRREVGMSAWQSTHLGGHRFAATLVCLPEGVVYGYVDADDVEGLITHTRKGTVRLDKLRGRSCYDDVTQAADQFLRDARSIPDLTGMRLIDTVQLEPDRWVVRFETLREQLTWAVYIERYQSEFDVFKDSAGDGAPVSQFRLVEIRLAVPER